MTTDDISTIFGPLAELYADPEISTIMVDAPDKVYITEPGHPMAPKVETDVSFGSIDELRQVIDALMSWGGITLGPNNTSGEVRLPDGSRLLAALISSFVG